MPTKAQRGMLGKALLGLGCLLMAAAVLTHLRPPAPAPRAEANPTASADETRITSSSGGAETTFQRAVSASSPTDASPEHAVTPFLRALSIAMKSIDEVKDSEEQEAKLKSLLANIPASEIPAALAELLKGDGPEWRRELGNALVHRWAALDPWAVANWLSRTTNDTGSPDGLAELATVWANQNLTEATAWARGLAEGETRQDALLSVAYEASRVKPLEAITLAMELTPGQTRDDLLRHASMQWAAVDPRAAAEWASQMSDQSLRDSILSGIAAAWGETDPTSAATLALNSLPPGRSQNDAVVGIVQRWVQQDPVNAAMWVAQFPDGILRETALENVVRLWADQDVAQVARWLDGSDLGASQDTAVRVYVSKISSVFPETAVHWAEFIEDDDLRATEMERVAEAWLLTDAASARIWIVDSELTQATKQRLLEVGPH